MARDRRGDDDDGDDVEDGDPYETTAPRLMWIVSRFCVPGPLPDDGGQPTSHRCARGWQW